MKFKNGGVSSSKRLHFFKIVERMTSSIIHFAAGFVESSRLRVMQIFLKNAKLHPSSVLCRCFHLFLFKLTCFTFFSSRSSNKDESYCYNKLKTPASYKIASNRNDFQYSRNTFKKYELVGLI